MAERQFFIQWDSTNDCNLGCSHCYHNREGEDHAQHAQVDEELMRLDQVTSMVDDLQETAKRWGFIPRLQISGGEPMLRTDLMAILQHTKELGMETKLLSNGTLMTAEKARELYEHGVRKVQISLDGSKEIHNRIRRRDFAYDLALEGVRNCTQAGILVNVCMTVMQSNKGELESVVQSGMNAGAGIAGFKSYVPDKELGANDSEYVGARETYESYKEIRALRKKYEGKIRVLEHEVLWQILQWDTHLKRAARETGKFLSGCGAGFSGFSVLSDGTVLPCRRLPIPIGKISDGVAKIMLESEVMQHLRNLEEMKARCGCEAVYYCRGCRAIAYAVTGDYMAKDPTCFKEYAKDDVKEPRVIRR